MPDLEWLCLLWPNMIIIRDTNTKPDGRMRNKQRKSSSFVTLSWGCSTNISGRTVKTTKPLTNVQLLFLLWSLIRTFSFETVWGFIALVRTANKPSKCPTRIREHSVSIWWFFCCLQMVNLNERNRRAQMRARANPPKLLNWMKREKNSLGYPPILWDRLHFDRCKRIV